MGRENRERKLINLLISENYGEAKVFMNTAKSDMERMKFRFLYNCYRLRRKPKYEINMYHCVFYLYIENIKLAYNKPESEMLYRKLDHLINEACYLTSPYLMSGEFINFIRAQANNALTIATKGR